MMENTDKNLIKSILLEPENIERLSTGITPLTEFWEKMYLQEYISCGGSKMKFVTGRKGSGKTFFLREMEQRAEKQNFITVSFSAEEIWLHDFREIYVEIFRQCDLLACLKKCAEQIVRNMAYEPEEIREGMTFIDLLSLKGENNALTKRTLRQELKEMFLDDPLMDNNFALCCTLIVGGLLGYPSLEDSNRDLLLAFLGGDKSVRLSMLRALGLSPSRITRYNARHMLRSLCEVVRLAGFGGLFVTIDNLEILINRNGTEQIRYTKMRRDDAYESIRQMIDDIDTLKNIMIVFGFDRELMDHENYGMKSYQALWMRIQNEVMGKHFNKFADIINLDKFGEEFYTAKILVEMSEKLTCFLAERNIPAKTISAERAVELLEEARFGGVGLVQLVFWNTWKGGRSDDEL